MIAQASFNHLVNNLIVTVFDSQGIYIKVVKVFVHAGQLINQLFIEVLGPGDRQVSYLWTLISECPQFSVGTELQKNHYCWQYLNKH